ncbi:MAG: hypothetical protein ACHQ4G_09535 [Opitutales bacterium]
MAGPFFRFFAAATGLLAAAPILPATEPGLNALLQNSPFGNSPTLAAPTSGAPLEFRGVMAEGGTYYFSIFEAASARSAWVRLNETANRDFVARNYDAKNQQLAVNYQGADLTLALTSAPVPTPLRAGPAVTPLPAAAVPAPPKLANVPEAETERLRKITEEIRRRRALRVQSINSTQAGLTP